MKPAAILARGYFGTSKAKTAHGLIRHGKIFQIKEVVDETLAGKDAGEILGLGKLGIPIVKDFSKDIDSLIIGIAPPGGKLPKKWRADIKRAIKYGINIVSGMHEFLSNDKELATLAKKYSVKIWDVRKYNGKLELAKGYKHKVPVVLVAGTDSCVGKRTTALELVKVAQKKGLNAGFVATGQTGIMIGCDAGVAVDAIPSDFVSGIVEKMVKRVSAKKEIIFVEGQGSLLHSAFGAVALGILHGTKPEYVIVVHDPARNYRNSYPEKIPKLESEIEAIQRLGNTKVIGISLNCQNVTSWEKIVGEYERKYKLPATDVLRDKEGADKLLKAIVAKIESKVE
ncbi:MAG: DUF1611 domain-containing protein [Candidatus Thermoplasmatota archaeon]